MEWKLDGVRIQVHRAGDAGRACSPAAWTTSRRGCPRWSRPRWPLPVRAAVLDGEAIALAPDGRPAALPGDRGRVAGRLDVERLRREVPLTPFVFDVLHLDGRGPDRPPGRRARRGPGRGRPGRPAGAARSDAPDAAAAGERSLRDALARGHEGVVVKSLAAPYAPGRRGAGWLKVKPRHTLDLVVLAAEWGHGRRAAGCRNLHLGARDPGTAAVRHAGQDVQGADRRDARAGRPSGCWRSPTARRRHACRVRPELVVEIAFDGVQTAPRYPGGVALRFARVLRYRPDKRAAEADTIEAVRALHEI